MTGVPIHWQISKNIWSQPSTHTTILVGYLPVVKLDCYNKATRSVQGYWLFYHCMGMIFRSLIKARVEGVEMVCADRWIQDVYVILAAYVTDFPEQCLVICCMENRCPRCTVNPKDWGSCLESRFCNKTEMLELLSKHQQGRDPPEFEKQGLQAVYNPFWADLPHCDIFSCFTSDFFTNYIKASSRIISSNVHANNGGKKNLTSNSKPWTDTQVYVTSKKEFHQFLNGQKQSTKKWKIFC